MTDLSNRAGPGLGAATGLAGRITKVEAVALSARFEDMFGAGSVPDWLLFPAASHSVLPRQGQFATLIAVHTDQGLVGYGESYGLPNPEITAQIAVKILAPLIVGLPADASTAVWETMWRGQAAGGHNRGFYLEAMAGIDLALWDLRGKATGLSVGRLLGGPLRETVPCYASPVPLRETPEESAEAALVFVEQGFLALKVKIGRGADRDGEHLRAVRDAVGDGIDVLVDANCAYALDEATRVGAVLHETGVRWFEEPLAVVDVAGLAELRRRTGLTIVTGETSFTRFDLREFVLKEAVDVYMPNIARSGGITESQRIAALASAFQVDIAPHGVGSGVSLSAALQFCAATPNFRTYEYNRLPNALRENLLTTPPEFRDGELVVPDRPGLGVELDADVVDRFTVGALSS